MPRRSGRANVEWLTGEGHNFTWEQVGVEVLMDIRSELRQLNSTLACYRVQRMADAMIRAEKRLAKHMPLQPPKRGKKA